MGNQSKAVIYVRVSSKEQEREGFSIPAQKKLLTEYALTNNFAVIKVFEESESAKSAGRTQFKKMLTFLKENPEIRIVLVEKTDRLYRNNTDYVNLDPDKGNLEIHLVKEGGILSKESPSHQKFMHGIKVQMAKFYSDNLSEEVIKGMSQKALEGLWPSVAPIGYTNNRTTHTIEPDAIQGPIIKRAFELASTGQYSLSKLKRILYNEGLRSARAKAEMSKSQMQRVLTNPIYFGDFVWKGQYYKGKHHPLITKQLFDKVQVQMGYVKRSKLTKHNFAFTNTMTCAHCGCSITAEEKRKKSGKSYIYYHCTSGKGRCDNVIFIREEIINDWISDVLLQIQIPENIIEWTREALLESHQQERKYHQSQIETLDVRYRTLQLKIDKAYEDKLEGHIDHDFWITQNSRWKEEQTQIQSQLTVLRTKNTAYIDHGLNLLELAKQAATLFKTMTNDEKRELVNLVLSNPRIENGSLRYDLKKPFSMLANVYDLEKWRS